jgi:hypothetical protein
MGLLKRVDYFGLKYARRNLKRIPDAVHSPGCDVSMPNHIVKRHFGGRMLARAAFDGTPRTKPPKLRRKPL